MIIFELGCNSQHRFEGWFASGQDFERQLAAGMLVCPVCGSAEVSRIPHAKIARGDPPAAAVPAMPPDATPPAGVPAPHIVAAFIDHVLRHTEDVGRMFPEEARRIHREEAPARSIRGTASREETEALLDEGIEVFPLPIPPKTDWN
jgi:hypothetical protein